jgi:hypothetical protein
VTKRTENEAADLHGFSQINASTLIRADPRESAVGFFLQVHALPVPNRESFRRQ